MLQLVSDSDEMADYIYSPRWKRAFKYHSPTKSYNFFVNRMLAEITFAFADAERNGANFSDLPELFPKQQ